MIAWTHGKHPCREAAGGERGGSRSRRAGRRGHYAADAGRGRALPARPVHAARARGSRAPLADRPAPGRRSAVRRDRSARPHVDCDGDPCRPVAQAWNRGIPDCPRADAPARAEAAVTGFTRAGDNGRLTLAVPAKGRMAEPALRLCADAGLSFEVTERSLVVPCANAPVDLLLVRPSDIPEYAQDGVVDVGITGANLVAEADAEVVTLAELGFARCSLDAAVPVDSARSAIGDLDGLRVATAYPVSTRRLLAERAVECELIPVSGSVEATPRLGLADAIVDLVSTGSTMSANGLRPIGTLLTSQAVLVGGRAAIEARREAVEQLELMVSGVVAGRRRRYVMMNAHVDDLPAIRAVLPGMGAPSVLQLADDGEIAVHAAVEVDEIWNLLPVLRRAGATSILVLPIERLVA